MFRICVLLIFLLSACYFPKPQEQHFLTSTPPLAARGPHRVGLRTVKFLDAARNNRPVVISLWYPTNAQERSYPYSLRLGFHDYSYSGSVAENAEPKTAQKFPLILYSHTQLGERQQIAYALEHLASYGFVVAGIDHFGATPSNPDFASYVNGLVNRPEDVLFVISELKAFQNIDASRLGLFGYSYGGFTMFNVAGVGISEQNLESFCTNHALDLTCLMRGYMPELEKKRGQAIASLHPSFSAIMVLAPFGAPWLSTTALQQLHTPLFVLAGTADQTALYARDAKHFFEQAASNPKYLLSLQDARHNVFKMCPSNVPAETYDFSECDNNSLEVRHLVQHFATAFFGQQLLDNQNKLPLNLGSIDATGMLKLESGN